MDWHTTAVSLMAWVMFFVMLVFIIVLPTLFFCKIKKYDKKLKDLEDKIDKLCNK